MRVFAVFNERGEFVRAISNEQNAIQATPARGERISLVLVRNDEQKLWAAPCKHGTLIKRDMSGWEFSTESEKPAEKKSLNKQKKVDVAGEET